jgi:hypothetical protein
MRLSVPTIASNSAHFRRRLSFVASSASSNASAARTFLEVRVNLRAFLRLQLNLCQPRLVIDRHGGFVFLGLENVINVDVISEHRLCVLVAAFNRRACETNKRCLWQSIAHVFGKAINEIVLAAVRLICNDNDVAPVGEQRMLAAFSSGKNF